MSVKIIDPLRMATTEVQAEEFAISMADRLFVNQLVVEREQ
jgi:hypothetical protein